jgi:hypothetical protein
MTDRHITLSSAQRLPVSQSAGGFDFSNLSEMMQAAEMMASGKVAVPRHCRGEPGVCFAVIMQAYRWRMDPFEVARQSYVVNDQITYMAGLIHSLVLARAPIRGRVKAEYAGEGMQRSCRVWADLADGTGSVDYTSPPVGRLKREKGSPLWTTDPDQQLFYYSIRALARRHFPDIIMGVYSKDEMEDAIDVTPNPLPPRQTLADRLESLAGSTPAHDPDTGEVKPVFDDEDVAHASDLAREPQKPEPELPSPYNTPENQPSTYDAIDDTPDDEWLINPDSAAYKKGIADGQEKTGRCRSSKVLADPQMLANWRAGYESVSPLEGTP